jgi:hypothetical protein
MGACLTWQTMAVPPFCESIQSVHDHQYSMMQVLLPVHLAKEDLIGIKNFEKKKKKKRATIRKATI